MSGQAAEAAPLAGAASHPIRGDLVALARLAGPVVGARLGIMTMGMTDAIVVGRTSAIQLGYHALAWAVVSAVLSGALGLLMGVQVMASRALGEGQPQLAGAALRRGLVYALWLGVASGVIMAVGGPMILGLLHLRGDLAAGAARPLMIFAVSLPSFTLSVAAASWLEGLGRPTPPMLLMWLANIANLAVDLMLVPGSFGLPAMGAVGAACATFTARTLLAVATLVYIARMKDARALGVFDKPPRDRVRERQQRHVGYGGGAANFFEVLAFSSMNIIAGWISPLAVAAWAVVQNVAALIFMVPLGLSTATAVLVGQAHGRRDEAGMQRATMVGFAVTAAFGVLVAAAIWPSAHLIAAVYTADPATIAMASAALALCCLFFLPDAIQVVMAQALRARGDVMVPTLTHMISYIVVMAPLAYGLAFSFHFGLDGVVWAVIVASFLASGLLFARFRMLAARER